MVKLAVTMCFLSVTVFNGFYRERADPELIITLKLLLTTINLSLCCIAQSNLFSTVWQPNANLTCLIGLTQFYVRATRLFYFFFVFLHFFDFFSSSHHKFHPQLCHVSLS